MANKGDAQDSFVPGLYYMKDGLDTLNSLSWFIMDASWMMGYIPFAMNVAVLVFVTGVLLVLTDKRPTHVTINLAILSWIGMNISWMISEDPNYAMWRTASLVCLVLGIFLVACSALLSKDLKETFSHFRRFRVKRWL